MNIGRLHQHCQLISYNRSCMWPASLLLLCDMNVLPKDAEQCAAPHCTAYCCWRPCRWTTASAKAIPGALWDALAQIGPPRPVQGELVMPSSCWKRYEVPNAHSSPPAVESLISRSAFAGCIYVFFTCTLVNRSVHYREKI